MAFDKFLIAPIETGLQKNVKPWLIQEDAFEELNNAYMFRGRLRKRPGSLGLGTILDETALTSRLRINLGNTDGNGDIAGTVPGAIFKVGQMFSIGSETFTVTTAGAQDMITTGAATTHTYNTGTGAYDIQDADPATACYFYPAEPVMGFANYENIAINDEPTFAFDTQFAYQFAGGQWTRLATGGAAALWSGSDSDFFWSTNYRGITGDTTILFVSNYTFTDQLRYWDGATWTAWNPAYLAAAGNTVESARIVLPFKDRLIFLNTKEEVGAADTTFVNRCRFSQNGSPLAADAFREDIPGKGGFIDAPTKEAIVGAQLLRDRLIVFFERSTWELVYTGNQVLPFVWQQINIELGVESTFSVIPFDKVILGVGENGIHACNGANVERVDVKIPDEVFKFHNDSDGPARVHGIRDYSTEVVYWTVPHSSNYADFPNRVLVFNYKNKSWSFFDDSITAFGYYWNSADIAWTNYDQTWEDTGGQWNDGMFESKFREVVAGNQQGFTFVVLPDVASNARSLQITDIAESGGAVTITSIDHNLNSGDWIYIDECEGIVELNGFNFKVELIDADTFTIDEAPAVTGTYTGSGIMALVSKIDIKTKQFNFYSPKGSNTYIAKVDFYIDKTDGGEITIDSFASSSTLSLREASIATETILGTGILETSPYPTVPLQDAQDRFWHAVYFQSEGETVQLRIYFTDDQMKDDVIPFVDFQLHGMFFHTAPTSEI